MTPSESAFLERAVVQLLFVSGREYALESLRDKLRELFVQEVGCHRARGGECRQL